MEGKIITGARFFEGNPEKTERLEVLKSFVFQALDCTDRVLIAINIEADRINTVSSKSLQIARVEVFGVTPWGKFIQSLNALVYKAKLAGADFFLSASVETKFTSRQIAQLQTHMDKNTLVVGAALEGHDFQEGEKEGNGRTVPWGTLAIWNLEHLSKSGFPLIGDAPFNPEFAGVEELTTIAWLQYTYPRLTAKLIEVPGIGWKTDDFDPERRKKHEKKMQSKIQRPAEQMKILGIPAPKVIHLR